MICLRDFEEGGGDNSLKYQLEANKAYSTILQTSSN